ncbi:MAG: outer membrane beta-barrel protein [Myxococcota bacterium]|nr:outer membrane beta-barrel protein [Myxococcota bacterium]
MGRFAFRLLALAAWGAAVTPTVAHARPASTGWYAEGGFGAVTFLPAASSSTNTGPSINLRVGRDLVSWFSFGLSFAASSHEATVPAPPEGEWFQLYRGGADARLGGRVDRIALFVEGGATIALISSNILGKVMITEPGESFALAFHAGGGLEYQLENRHYAFGAAIDAFLIPQFDATKAVDSRLYLRYTY